MAERQRVDSLAPDSAAVSVDSVSIAPRKRRSIVDFPINYQCDDSLMVNLDEKLVYMYGKSDVKAEQMSLVSDHMRIDMNTSCIFAEGKEDSLSHEVDGEPNFKDGSDEFTAKVMKYNFKTKEGHVIDVVTEQQDGMLYGQVTKMHSNREIHFKGGKYTTCDAEHPHFYLDLTRAKMIPDDKIVSGPCYFVFLDVPVYVLGLPFVIFPTSKKTHNGVIIPKYGEESRRGFYLQEGGYYFAFSDYADLKLTASYYTVGSWGVRASSQFKLRYKFSGNFDFNFTKNVTGKKEFMMSRNPDIKYSSTNSYTLKFNFNQDSKANPYSSFGVNISYDKQQFDKYNATSVQDYAKSTTSSSVNYQRRMFGGKANLSIAGNMTQNLYDSTVALSAPTLAFSVNRFFPFKRRVQVGSQKWYEKIGSSFNLNFQNTVPTMKDSLLFKPEMFDKMRYGLKYSIPLSTSFNLLKYIQVSPSISYTGRVYPNYVRRYPKNDFTIGANGDLEDKYTKYGYGVDTIDAIRHNFDFNASVSASTKLYGMFLFNKAKHIKAFRHVLTPSMGLSWRPDFSEEFWNFYEYDPSDYNPNEDERRKYSFYQNGVYGTPPAGKSASLNFGLGNNFEMKVKGRKDTVEGEYTKIKLLENLNFTGSYNMAADSMKLSPISMSGSTRLFDKMTISFGGNFDPYALDENGRRTKNFCIKDSENRKLARLTNFRASTGFSFNSKQLGKKKLEEKKAAAEKFGEDELQAEVDEDGNIIPVEDLDDRKKGSKISEREKNGEFDYSDVPWNVSASYSFNYNHPDNKAPRINQTLNLNGSIQFTDKWSTSISSGYDFDARKMTSTRITVTRDLHCFSLSFYIIPFGTLKSYNFTLAINSSMFQGVEYKRTANWRDN